MNEIIRETRVWFSRPLRTEWKGLCEQKERCSPPDRLRPYEGNGEGAVWGSAFLGALDAHQGRDEVAADAKRFRGGGGGPVAAAGCPSGHLPGAQGPWPQRGR